MKPNVSMKHEDSVTIAFRVPREDALRLQLLCDLSGMVRQDYLRERIAEREITVYPNVRVRKYIKQYLTEVRDELRTANGNPSVVLLQRLDDILYVIEKM